MPAIGLFLILMSLLCIMAKTLLLTSETQLLQSLKDGAISHAQNTIPADLFVGEMRILRTWKHLVSIVVMILMVIMTQECI